MSWLSPRLLVADARALAPVGVNTAVPVAGLKVSVMKLKLVIATVSAYAVEDAPSSNPKRSTRTKTLGNLTLMNTSSLLVRLLNLVYSSVFFRLFFKMPVMTPNPETSMTIVAGSGTSLLITREVDESLTKIVFVLFPCRLIIREIWLDP